MADDEFPKINRGNGVANDNLATLGDIMLATLKKVRDLETKIEDTKSEITGVKKETIEVKEQVSGVKATIQSIDKTNAPMAKKSYWLLIATVLIGLAGLVLSYFAIHH